MATKGVYYGLVEAQNLRSKNENGKEEEEIDDAEGREDVSTAARGRALSQLHSIEHELSSDGKTETIKKTDEEADVISYFLKSNHQLLQFNLIFSV